MLFFSISSFFVFYDVFLNFFVCFCVCLVFVFGCLYFVHFMTLVSL